MTAQSILHGKLAAIGTAYPVIAPAKPTYPHMVYQFISEAPQRSHSGASLTRHRVQVSCWSTDYAAACALADSVVSALDLNQTGVQLITHENSFEDAEPETKLYRRLLEFFIWL